MDVEGTRFFRLDGWRAYLTSFHEQSLKGVMNVSRLSPARMAKLYNAVVCTTSTHKKKMSSHVSCRTGHNTGVSKTIKGLQAMSTAANQHRAPVSAVAVRSRGREFHFIRYVHVTAPYNTDVDVFTSTDIVCDQQTASKSFHVKSNRSRQRTRYAIVESSTRCRMSQFFLEIWFGQIPPSRLRVKASLSPESIVRLLYKFMWAQNRLG